MTARIPAVSRGTIANAIRCERVKLRSSGVTFLILSGCTPPPPGVLLLSFIFNGLAGDHPSLNH
jgi:hypothetical protein